jgi:hypothetical protein
VSGSYLPGPNCPATLPANPTGGVVVVFGNGDYLNVNRNIQIVPMEGTGFQYGTVTTSLPVTSCSVDQNLILDCSGGVCTSFMGVCTSNVNTIYEVDVGHPTAQPIATLTDSANGLLGTSGGDCSTCGVVVDSSNDVAVVGINLTGQPPFGGTSAYQLLSLTNNQKLLNVTNNQFGNQNQFGTPITVPSAEIAESWEVDPVHSLILSATEGIDYQIFDISNPVAPIVYNSLVPVGGSNPFDSTALDSTGIALTTVEASNGESQGAPGAVVIDLSRAVFTPDKTGPGSFNAPGQGITIGAFSFFASGLTAIAMANGSHEALVIDEFGGGNFGAIQLPAVGGNGLPTITDAVSAVLPPDPSGAGWAMTNDPHGLSAASACLNGNRGLGFILNLSRTFVAEVDLAKLLAAPRQSNNSIVQTDYDLIANGVVKYVAVIPGTLQLSANAVNFGSVPAGSNVTGGFTIANISTNGFLEGNVNASGISLPFSVVNAGAFAVKPSGTENVQITFAPSAPGSYSGTIVLTTNDAKNPSITIPVTGTAF